MQRVKLGLVCLSWLLIASAVSAQSAAVDPTTGVASVSNFSGGGMLDGTYFDVRHVIGDGVGYQNSYSQIGAFTPFWITDDSLIAPNSRLIVTNSTQTGVNTGLVARQYVNGWDRIFGVYGYYDNDEDSRNFRYSQATFGAETLGRWWDLRGNAYFVNGMNTNFIAAQGLGGQPYYMGHNIDFMGRQLQDKALSGGDAEFGVPMSPSTPWLRGYAGAYGYQTGPNNTYGFRGRLEANVSNDLTLSVMVSNDAIYGTNVNGVIDFKFSGFQPTVYFPRMTTRQRMLNPVQRNWRIATRTEETNVNIAAINPATGKPYFIVHVNNTAPAGGDGTIEHPFNHLQNLPQADIILVHRGTATSTTNTVTGSAVLHDNERLLGDGILSTVQLEARFGPNSVFGTYNLPQTANTGIYPYVTNPTGNIVTLANNNEVAGLNLWGAGAGGTAITNTAAGSHNFNLHNLEIFNNTGKGIDLANASGSGIINKINVGTTDHANPGGFGNNTAGGIQIASGGSGLFLNMSNVNMNASAPASQAFGVSLTANNAGLTSLMNNVMANGNGQGIAMTESSQALNVTMNSVRANNNAGTGIQVSGTGGSIGINGADVAAMDNGSNNLQIGTQAAPIVTSTVGVTMTQANFSGSKNGSGIVFSMSGGGGTLNLPGPNGSNGATVSKNHLNGLSIFATNSALMNANVQNGQFTLNGGDAFHVVEDTFSKVNLFVDPTNASLNGGNGLFFSLAGGSTLNTSFLNSNLNNNNKDAIDGILTNLSTVNLFFDGTTGANSGGTGLNINATGNSVANLEVDHGSFTNSGRLIDGSSAINVFSDASTVNLLTDMTKGDNLAPSLVPANQAYGLTMTIQNGSQFTGTIENGGFSHALVDAVKATVTSGSTANLTLFNTDSSHAGFDGLVTTVNNATLNTTFTNSNVNNSGRNGMTLDVTNAGKLNSSFDNSSLNGSGGSGIFATVTGTNSIATLILSNNSDVIGSGNSGLNFNVNAGTLNVADTSGSFSGNGAKGVTGSGVLGVVDNNGVARLDFINTQVNNNLDSGIFVTTNNGSSIQAQFSIASIANNGVNQLSPHTNDGILLQINDSPFSSLTLTNGASVSGNGNDGIAIVATQNSVFQGVFNSISILDNGVAPPPFQGTRAGFDVVTKTGSNVGLSFDGATIGNTAAGGTQQTGFLSSSFSNSVLTANLTSVDLSNNGANAINTSVATNATTNMDLVNVTGDNSGNTGALFNVTTGGQLNVDSSVGASFSNSGGSGILVQVSDAGSVANMHLDTFTLQNNGIVFGGQGFNGLAVSGGTLNACIDTSTILNNSNQGIALAVAGANSIINFNVSGTNVDFNGSEGLLANVSNQGVMNYRSNGSTYTSNGANGTFDGVNISVVGNGASDSAIGRFLFANGAIDSNSGNGLSLDAENGATLTTSIQNMSISNNAGFGIASTATGANTKFNLIMSGTNTTTGNGSGDFNTLSFSNIDQLVLAISGSSNGSTGDGLHIDVQNVNNAVVAVEGPGTFNQNAGNGINIDFLNVTNGSVLVDGVTQTSANGGDGIRVDFETVANGAISIIGPTTANNNGANAVDVIVNNSTLVDGISFGAANVQVLTLTDNLVTNNFLNGCLPEPVTFTLNQTGLVSTQALTISGIAGQTSALDGINVSVSGSTIDTLSLLNNTIATANGAAANSGDTIHVDLTNTPVTTLNVIGNQVGGAVHNGFNFNLNGSPITTANIVNNTVGLIVTSGGTPVDDSAPVIVPGFNSNTLAANDDNSTGAVALGFAADFFGTTYNNVFVNNNGNVTFTGPLAAFTPFSLLTTATPIIAPFFGDVDTRSGNPVTYGTGTINGHNAFGVNWLGVDHFSAVGGGTNGQPPNSFQLVMIDRSDVAPGDFDFEFNYQSILWESGTASGGNAQGLGGSSARAGYSNGTNASMELAGSAVNGAFLDSGPAATALIHNSLNSVNDGRYIFFVRGGLIGGPSPSGLDGMRLNATNGSNIGTLNVTSNTIENSGSHGIELLQSNSGIGTQTYTNNTITNNGGDGIRMVNPTTPTSTVAAVFQGNTVSTNGGTGINLNLTAGQQDLRASFASNTINGNTGGPGINIQLADNHNMTGGFDSNTVTGNSAQGININTGLNGQITSNFTSNTINGNTGDGIHLGLSTGGHFEGAQFYGNTIGTAASRNGGMGVNLAVPDQASFNWNLGDSTQATNLITGNTGAGVGINMTGSANGNLTVQNSTFSNTVTSADPNFNGQGLAIVMNNTATLNNAVIGNVNAVNSIATNNTTFSNNAGAGLSFNTVGNSTVQNLLITNVNALNNTGDGISISRIGNPTFTGTVIQNNQLNSNANGLHIVAGNALLVDDYTINNNQIQTNRNDGVLLDARFDAQIVANMTSNTINGNTGDGIHVIEQNNASSDNRLVSGTWTLNTITNNTSNGIQISARNNILIGATNTEIDNVITGNGGAGIRIDGVNAFSTTVIQGNEINSNGTNGITVNATANIVTIDTNQIDNNTGDGIQMLARNGATLTASIDNSEIRFNTNDGIAINSAGQNATGGFVTVTIGANNPNGNDISDNSGHGITILNQAQNNGSGFNGGNASYTIQNNAINRNGLEGVYAVNSADANQTQNNTVTTTNGGNVFDNSQMVFVMNNNSVLDNGHLAIGANFSDVTGLYLRVGTNGASQSFTDPGGFASTASAVNSINTANLTGRGGVLALVTNNLFGGNAGHDVGFDSFTSTQPPVTTSGAWSDQNDQPPNPANDVFTVNQPYQTDPLARLDLKFTGNTGEDANVTRSGAFYNNAEPIFKSRSNNVGTASPTGPFNSATRDRNAQRLASRDAPFNAPVKTIFGTSGSSDNYLYPGVGNSTFRVTTNSNTTGFGSADTFGSAVGLGGNIGELPFTWDQTLAP